jgi:hypothetical protein
LCSNRSRLQIISYFNNIFIRSKKALLSWLQNATSLRFLKCICFNIPNSEDSVQIGGILFLHRVRPVRGPVHHALHRGEHHVHGPRPSRHGPGHGERAPARKLCKISNFKWTVYSPRRLGGKWYPWIGNSKCINLALHCNPFRLS